MSVAIELQAERTPSRDAQIDQAQLGVDEVEVIMQAFTGSRAQESAMGLRSAAIVAAVCVAEVLGLAGYSTVPALLPQFIEAWSLTNTLAGWLAGILSAGYMLPGVPLVSLTDGQPARRIYLASGALSALSCFGRA